MDGRENGNAGFIVIAQVEGAKECSARVSLAIRSKQQQQEKRNSLNH